MNYSSRNLNICRLAKKLLLDVFYNIICAIDIGLFNPPSSPNVMGCCSSEAWASLCGAGSVDLAFDSLVAWVDGQSSTEYVENAYLGLQPLGPDHPLTGYPYYFPPDALIDTYGDIYEPIEGISGFAPPEVFNMQIIENLSNQQGLIGPYGTISEPVLLYSHCDDHCQLGCTR